MGPVQVPNKAHDQTDQSSFGRSVQQLKKLAEETSQSPDSCGNGPTLLSSIQRMEKAYRNLPKAQQKDQALMDELGEALVAVVGVDDATFDTACKEACSFMTNFARVWSFQGAKWAASILPALAKKHGAYNEAMTAAVSPTMCALMSHCWDEHGHLLLRVLEVMNDDQLRPSTLKHFYELVKIIIEKWPPSAVEEHKDRLGQRFADDMRSSDPERVNTSQHHFAVLARKWPEVGTKVFKCLSKQLQGQVLQRHPLIQAHLNIKRSNRKAAGATPSPAGSKALPPHPHKLGMGPAEYQQRKVVKEGSQLEKLVEWKKRKDLLATDAIQDIVGDTASISTDNSHGSFGRSRNAEALAQSAKKHEELKKRKLNMMSPTLRHHLTADAKSTPPRIPASEVDKEAKGVVDLSAVSLSQSQLESFMSPAEAKSSRVEPALAEAKGQDDTAARRGLDMKAAAAAEPPMPSGFDKFGRMTPPPSTSPPEAKREEMEEDMGPDEVPVQRRVSFSQTPTVIEHEDTLAWSADTTDDTWGATKSSSGHQRDEHMTGDASTDSMLQETGAAENFELAGLRALDTYERRREEEEEIPAVNLTGFMAQEGDEAKVSGQALREVQARPQPTTEVPRSTRRWGVPLFFGFFALAALIAVALMDNGVTVELSNMVWGATKPAGPAVIVSDDKMKPAKAAKKVPPVTAKNSSQKEMPKKDKKAPVSSPTDKAVHTPIIKALPSDAKKEAKAPPKQVATPRAAAASGPTPSSPLMTQQVFDGRPSFGRRVHSLAKKIFTKKNALLSLMVFGIMCLFGMP